MRKSFTRLFGLLMALMLVSLVNLATGQTLVPLNAGPNFNKSNEVSATYTQNVTAGTVGQITLYEGTSATGTPVYSKTISQAVSSGDVVISGAKVVFKLPLQEPVGATDKDYFLTWDASAIKYVAGNTNATVPTWNIKVGDYTKPLLATTGSLSPADNALNLSPSTTTAITLTFNEAVGVTTGTERMYLMREVSGSEFGDVVEIFKGGTTFTSGTSRTFNVTLKANESYYVLVEDGFFRDASTNRNAFAGFMAKTEWNFTTRDVSAPAISVLNVIDTDASSATVDFELSKAGKLYYMVTNSGQSPTAAQVKAGVSATGVTAHKVGTITVTSTGIQTLEIATLSNTTATGAQYKINVVAETVNTATTTQVLGTVSNVIFTLDDVVKPTLSTLTPANNATAIADNADLSITFSENIRLGEGNVTIKVGSTVHEVIDIKTGKITNATIDLKPTKKFTSLTQYHVLVDAGAVTDEAGNTFAGISSTTSWTFTIGDKTAPTVTATTPANGATGVDVTSLNAANSGIKINFSENIRHINNNAITSGSLSNAFTLTENGVVTDVLVWYTQQIGERFLTVDKASGTFLEGKEYKLFFQSWFVEDLSDNAMTGLVEVSFKTKDTQGPFIEQLAYSDVVKDIANTEFGTRSSELWVKFDEHVYLGTTALTTANVGTMITQFVQNAGSATPTVLVSGTNYTASVVNNDTISIVVLKPTTMWAAGSTLSIVFNTTNVKDAAGNAYSGTGNSREFKIGDNVAPTVELVYPVNNGSSDLNNIQLKIVDNSNIYDTQATAQLLSASTISPTLFTLRNSGTGAQVVISGALTYVGDILTIPSSNLEAGASYELSVGTVLQDAFRNVVTPANFSFNINSAAAPSVATSTLGVLAVTPVPSSTGAAATAAITAEYNQGIKVPTAGATASVTIVASTNGGATTSTITVTSVTVDSANSKKVVIGHADLPANATVTVTIGAGAVTAQSAAAANSVAASWTFATVDTSIPVVSQFFPTQSASATLTTDLSMTFLNEKDQLTVKSDASLTLQKWSNSQWVNVETVTGDKMLLYTSGNNATVSVTLVNDLDPNTNYNVLVTQGLVSDKSGNAMNAIVVGTWSFTTQTSTFTLDAAASTPKRNINVATGTVNFNLKLTQAVGSSDVNKKIIISQLDPAAFSTVSATIADLQFNSPGVTISGKDVSFSYNLPVGVYSVSLESGIFTDTHNQSFVGDSYIFFVGDTYNQGPVATFSPANDATAAKNINAVVITFDESIFSDASAASVTDSWLGSIKGVVSTASLTVQQVGGGFVNFTPTITANNRINLEFAAGVLSSGLRYDVKVGPSTFYDAAGKTYSTFTSSYAGGVPSVQSAVFTVTPYSTPNLTITAIAGVTVGGTSTETINYTVNVNTAGKVWSMASASTTQPADIKTAGTLSYFPTAAANTATIQQSKISTDGIWNLSRWYVWAITEDVNGNTSVASSPFTLQDLKAPTITGRLISGGSATTNVARTASLTLTFSELMDVSLNMQPVVVRETNSGLYVGTYTVSTATDSGSTTSITSVVLTQSNTLSLKAGVGYTAYVQPGMFADKAGNKFNGSYSIAFTTIDNVKPHLTSITYPTGTATATYDGSSVIQVNRIKEFNNITLHFDEPVKIGTATHVYIYEDSATATGTITPGTDRLVEIVLPVISSDKKSATIAIEESRYDNLKTYAVYVAVNSFADEAGNTLSQTLTSFFRLQDKYAPVAAFSYSVAQATTDEANKNIHVATNLHVSFDEVIKWTKVPTDLTLTAEMAKSMVSLTDSTGAVVDIVVSINNVTNTLLSPATTNNTIKVDPVPTLKGHMKYTLRVVDVQDASRNTNTAGYTLNFWTGDESIGKAPVATFNPEHNTLNVEGAGPFVITFDKTIYAYTSFTSLPVLGPITTANAADYFTLANGTLITGTAISATYTVTDGRIVTITPSSPITSTLNVTYGVKNGIVIRQSNEFGATLTGGSSKDFAGVTFATVTIKDWAAPTLSSKTPEGSGTKLDANITLTFNEDIIGGTGSLYVRNHQTGAVVQKFDGTSSGVSYKGKKVTITPAAFLADTKYYVVIDQGFVKDLAGNAYAGIPDVNINSWTFTTRESDGPALTATYPAAGATEVMLNEELVITFDQAVKAGTGFVSLYRYGSGVPFATINISTAKFNASTLYSVADTVVTIPIGVNLESNTKYFVRIEAGAIQDKSNNAYAGLSGQSWYFTTEDGLAPQVSARIPADDATGVERNPMFEVHFDRNIEKGTGVVSLYKRDGETLVESLNVNSTSVSVAGKELHFHFADLLMANTDYYVYIQPGAITNASVNKLPFAGITTAWGWNFTTGANIVDRDAPAIVANTPVGVQSTVHQTFVIEFNEDVVAGAGKLNVYEVGTDSMVLMLDVADAVINGNVITFSYDKDNFSLTKSTEYYVLVDAAVVKDAAGNEFGGLASKTMWVFTTGPDYATSAPEIAHSNFKLYPNPFNNELNIDNHNKLSRVIITNIAGQRVMDIQFPERTISTSNLVSGVYIVTLVTNEGTTQSERIVKR